VINSDGVWGSVKCGGVSDQVSDCQLVKKDTAQWSVIAIVVIVTGIDIVSEVMSIHCSYSCIQFLAVLKLPFVHVLVCLRHLCLCTVLLDNV
jgi:hypothetical protein